MLSYLEPTWIWWQSHPSRVRGLKCHRAVIVDVDVLVAPFTGAWIEILYSYLYTLYSYLVAPFTGAWIEIFNKGSVTTNG